MRGGFAPLLHFFRGDILTGDFSGTRGRIPRSIRDYQFSRRALGPDPGGRSLSGMRLATLAPAVILHQTEVDLSWMVFENSCHVRCCSSLFLQSCIQLYVPHTTSSCEILLFGSSMG